MKTKSTTQIKINVITLGCSKNIVDSEFLLKQLDIAKFEISHNSPSINHDIVIINTCGFINDAKKESIDTIFNVVKAKQKGFVKKIVVMGCLSERYYNELKKDIPEVDEYFGVNKLQNILSFLGEEYKHELVGERLLTTPSHYAYLKISEGCNRKCSFCAIPIIRGKYVSKTIDDLSSEASLLAEKGVKELILIAQDLTYYGADLYKKKKLALLLEKLSEIKGIEWIRLQYAYPTDFPADVLKIMNENEKICKYLDIPFQHINDTLLNSMKRGHSKEYTYNLIKKIRENVKDVALRTSIIVGYPGETNKEFNELIEFVNDVKFDRLGVFEYSHEESTGAYSLVDSVKSSVKRKRAEQIMTLQENISLNRNQTFIGKTLKVLFDRVEGEYLIGRTEYDSPEIDNEVLIKNSKLSKLVGKFCKVKIIQADNFDLYGEIAKK
ncbi:MAG: 30S ribosomal protein S12 methylthiotransferase RimO [Bacteroidetes bacterium]|nr:30S ribosomal protein S12 methylthiotransferase RimO [Bacteroidota bacterium]